MTILLTPFMSCSAKIPIYAVFTAAFFPESCGAGDDRAVHHWASWWASWRRWC